jgi:glycosyltransferase involved in cell wall biosynthesis
MRTLIIIPCYNEEARLDAPAFIDFAAQHTHIHFLFVNDGSSDGTRAVLDGIVARASGSFSALHLPQNSGKAEAVRRGFLKGFDMGPELIGFLDADLASPLATIPALETALRVENKEIAMAARVILLGRRIERNPARHYAGRFFATAASFILGLRVYDTQCGAKIFCVTDRLKDVFATPFTVKWIFDVEILARFLITEQDGAPKVHDISLEHPLREWVDKKGSKLRPVDFLTGGLDLVKIFFLMKRKRRR